MKKFGHLCRICIKDSCFFMNIYVHRPNNEYIYKIINKIGELNACRGDGLPEHICSECYKKLLEIMKFKVMCQNGMAALHVLKTKYSGDSDVPPVAEPVQVFVDMPTASIESSNVIQEEVDPFEDVENPLYGIREKGRDKRPLEGEDKDVFLCGERDAAKPSGVSDHPHELVAYSLQSDDVISSEEGDEKPAPALKSFYCSLDNCHSIFNRLDELNNHQRSCHLSVQRMHQFGAGGDCDEIQMVSPSEGKSGKLHCRDSLRVDRLKLSKRRRSTTTGMSINSNTISFDGMGPVQAQSTHECVNDCSLSDSKMVLSGDSSQNFATCSDAGTLVKVKTDEDVEQDVICVDSKFFCHRCSLTFKEESSFRKHMSEKHLKSTGAYACGGKGERSLEGDGKADTTQGVHRIPLPNEEHVGRHPGKILIAHDVCERGGSTLSHQWQTNAEAALRVVKPCDRKGISSIILEDHMHRQTGQMSDGGTICSQKLSTRNVLEGQEVTQSTMSTLGCDVCGRLFEVVGDAHLERNRGGTANICELCAEKVKPSSSVNDGCKNPRRHQCFTCGQTYSMKSALKRHERVHTGERPYVCGICARTYTRNEYLKDHMKSHYFSEANQSTS